MSNRVGNPREDEIRALIRKVIGFKDPTHRDFQQRREVLKILIELRQSPTARLKMLVAREIPQFFNNFADLEEDSINAVYDLCEDAESMVRIEGYLSIGKISRTDRKWIKRNADVLIQLLQSDEPTEAKKVREALVEHINLDAAVTLGVFCDQIIPSDEATDEEEQALRVRLRELVLEFLKEKAHPILEQHILPESDAERVLLDRITKEIGGDHFHQLSQQHITVLVQDLLGRLQGSPKLQEATLKALYRRAEQCVLSKTSEPPNKALFYLDEAAALMGKQRITEQIAFLQHAYQSLLRTSRSLPVDLRTLYICRVVNYFSILDISDGSEVLAPIYEQLANLSTMLLQSILTEKKVPVKPTGQVPDACLVLLRAYRQHKTSSGPGVSPATLLPYLKQIIEAHSFNTAWPEVQKLARALIESVPSRSNSVQEDRSASAPPRNNSNLPIGPPRAQAPHSFRGATAPSASASASPSSTPSLVERRPPALTAPRPTKRESPLNVNAPSRPLKKPRKQQEIQNTNTNTNVKPPALLARLSASSVPSENGIGSPRRNQPTQHSQNRAGSNRTQGQPNSSNASRNPPGPNPSAPPSLSIKGAAQRVSVSGSNRPASPAALPPRPPVEQRTSAKLIDRVASPLGAGAGAGRGRRKR